jgi:tRNA(fMet)-specific endonuclease VapC
MALMAGFLLDTNHLGEAIRPVSRVRERIEQARRAGDRVGTCVPVLCELEVAIQSSAHRDRYEQVLDRLLRRIRLWPIERAVARAYGELYQNLRARGRVLSQVDIMLAALARSMDLVLVTSDRDFEALPHIHRENWLG